MKHDNNNDLRYNNTKIDWVTAVFLGIIIMSGLIIRLIFFPFEIPLILDNLAYFWYGLDMSITGSFPTNYDLANNTWPSLLSVFFSLFPSENFLDYMNLQRMISSIISVLTVIPMYFLCRHFFSKNVAIIGTAIFVFEPRIINNSILGITEPLFLIL